MIITDEVELWALISTLLEFKFGENGCSATLAGSFPLGKVIDGLWEEFQTTRMFQTMLPVSVWNARLQLTPERKEWSRIVGWITDTKAWNSWSNEQKQQFIRVLGLPCVIPPDHIDQLLNIQSN